MKIICKIVCFVALCILLATVVGAHSGRTDSSGGHYNRSTGEYHYHHGKPAHNHWDIDGDGVRDCPYEFASKIFLIVVVVIAVGGFVFLFFISKS